MSINPTDIVSHAVSAWPGISDLNGETKSVGSSQQDFAALLENRASNQDLVPRAAEPQRLSSAGLSSRWGDQVLDSLERLGGRIESFDKMGSLPTFMAPAAPAPQGQDGTSSSMPDFAQEMRDMAIGNMRDQASLYEDAFDLSLVENTGQDLLSDLKKLLQGGG